MTTAEKLVLTYIYAIGRDKIPNSMLWMAVDPNMSDLEQHLTVLLVMKRAGLVEEKFNQLSLTPAGLAILTEIEKRQAAKQEVKP